MVGNTASLKLRDFCSPHVEAAIQLNRIAIDDFALEFFGYPEREDAFAGPSRPNNSDDYSITVLAAMGQMRRWTK